MRKHLTQPLPIYGLVLNDLQAAGLYWRPISWKKSAADPPVMWDVVSDAPMSTEHANSRFCVPFIARTGWALFMDGDILVRSSLARMFERLESKYAVYCVKHNHRPSSRTKMDNQVQTKYARKNWSSFCVWNTEHPANRRLTLEMVNTLPGRKLHAFCWLEDDEIGELGPEWNYLVSNREPEIDVKVAHFTEGVPDMPGYETVPFAGEWRAARAAWARGPLTSAMLQAARADVAA